MVNPLDALEWPPKEMVFRSLESIIKWVEETQDLNSIKTKLIKSLNNVASWEPVITNIPQYERFPFTEGLPNKPPNFVLDTDKGQ